MFALPLLLTVVGGALPGGRAAILVPQERLVVESQHAAGVRLSRAAYEFLHALNCEGDLFFTDRRECLELMRIPRSAMSVYIAETSPYGKYRAFLPDRVLDRGRLHDGVVALDPYPGANFGHLVVVFFANRVFGRASCGEMKGYHAGHDQCLTLALRRRCRNATGHKSAHGNTARRCEINFLPVVVRLSEADRRHYHKANRRGKDRLRCRSDLPDFAGCPEFRSEAETAELICNPLEENTQRCSTARERIRTTCRPLEVCDQALIVSGGWNRHTSDQRHKRNVLKVYHMFRKSGFRRRNIQIFFANGAQDIRLDDEEAHEVHPAAMKLALRNHIRKLCTSAHCAETLVIYMNNPAKNDGTSLLWDINGDGVAQDEEMYKIGELKRDLKHCMARKVQLLIDQSYAGKIAESFWNPDAHRNVVVFASGKPRQYSFNDEFTNFWASSNHSHNCTYEVFEGSKKTIRHSSPEMIEGSFGQNRATLFGAPCHMSPPFTRHELKRFQGCKSVPTAVWIQGMRNYHHHHHTEKHTAAP